MRDKMMKLIRRHRLLLAFLAAALIKQILVVGVPICASPGTPCDDELMRDWAFSIAGFDWLGNFDAYTFLKEPGFAIFLAVCYRLHFSYIFTVTVCYSVACMIFASAFQHIFSSGKYVLCVYLLLLFHPISYCDTVLQRVYRNGLGVILTLCIFGGLLHMYFSIKKEKAWRFCLWSAFTGLSLGYLWITKSDTAWLLPFTVVISVVMLGILLVKYRSFRHLPRYLCLVLPFLGIFLCVSGVKFLNIHRYGVASIEYYGIAMDEISHIRQEENTDEKILLTRKQLRELYQISPTLASVKEELESQMDAHNTYDTRPEDGEVETGWLGWALVRAFYNAGVYEDSGKANDFFRNLHEELSEAFADGRLVRAEVPVAEKYHIDTPKHRRELAGRAFAAIDYMVSCTNTSASTFTEEIKGAKASIWLFERITGDRNAHLKLEHDYEIAGWIVFPEYDGQNLNVYVEDEKGSRYQKMRFKESMDVYERQKSLGIELESAKKCHFDTVWEAKESAGDTAWYLGVYDTGQPDKGSAAAGQKLGRVRIGKGALVPEGDMTIDAVLDAYECRKDRETAEAAAKLPAGRLNAIGAFYRVSGTAMFWLGGLAYVILTAGFIRGLCRREFELVNSWLIVTGFSLSVFVLALGIAYVDLTQCPAIMTHYMSSGYPLLISVEAISLLKCAELAFSWIRGVRKKEEQDGR